MANVAFIGLGVMGFPMAGHLTKAHKITVYNRSPARAEAWVAKYGNTSAPTPVAASKGAEIVFVCVGDDPDLRQVITGADGVLAGIAKGAVIVDHTTACTSRCQPWIAHFVAADDCSNHHVTWCCDHAATT